MYSTTPQRSLPLQVVRVVHSLALDGEDDVVLQLQAALRPLAKAAHAAADLPHLGILRDPTPIRDEANRVRSTAASEIVDPGHCGLGWRKLDIDRFDAMRVVQVG